MEKEKIGLLADELCDVSENLVSENNIGIIKYKIDLQELSEIPGNVFQKIREGERLGIKNLVKTSQPSINDFLSAFKEKLKNFEEVLCITFSSKISGSYNSAMQAKKFLEEGLQSKVHIFDSMGGSGWEGLVVLRAAALIKKNLRIDEITNILTKDLSNLKLLGMYTSPKWLKASGRFPRFVPAILDQAEKLNLKPVFGMINGALSVVGIKKNVKNLSTAFFEEFEKRTRGIRETGKKIYVTITHADNPLEAENLKKMILQLENVTICFSNLVCFPIGGHIGPDSMVLSWMSI